MQAVYFFLIFYKDFTSLIRKSVVFYQCEELCPFTVAYREINSYFT